ncbi:HAD family hydrolase [Streptomyces sp. Je 1-4]|uniref:HAD family hydrolase n=1 Tax=Streptomyces TaxID=1883 RepID=UPI0021DAF7A2|nr:MULTISPECIES: HAD family hydrolase [unclassified Streptomyces]UYB41711.1 HAD family hydrolase [Streptomyces sp. Je 1-4]UZQ37970.1 HAD family hydrolase [Streptomyces sp. Je 1-4] [Streptomyces sp. Je 1-4 4N24]UZQ45387.1 HAD family hydrolase [Streptomyces sp. Je 1-4] [Streptomyces sp. Je 1-4 4N24_ara]
MLALFDLDNTLIDRRGCLHKWARDFVRSRRLPRETVAVICDQLRERAYPADFIRLRETLGVSDPPDDLWREYVDGVARSVRHFPGVLEGLEELRRTGWSTGIATNGAGDIQRAKLDATGLTLLFDGVCISGEIGVRKPAYGHFEAAAEMCDTRLSADGWMVGDTPGTDIEGGIAAGLRTLWVANGRPWIYGPREPDIVVKDVAEAIDALQGLAT